jgi:hypothetical protein
MRIAISGTHFMGKTTLIDDVISKHPDYKNIIEPYHQLADEGSALSDEPTLESLLEQLTFSLEQLNLHGGEKNVIFDRCPLDFVAYAMCAADQEGIDLHDTEIAELFPEIIEALSQLDLIVFLPITNQHMIHFTEDNPAYRKMADACFKKIYRDDIYDLFPDNHHPEIIEMWGSRAERLQKLENYLH